MRRLMTILIAIVLAFTPTLTVALTPVDVEAKSAPKPCQDGYFRSSLTNRCKKMVTVSETASTITTTVYNPQTGIPSVTKVCKAGYWWNAKTSRCNKKKVCKIGYRWLSWNNTCEKIICEIGFKVQDASNICKRLVCERGHIINQKTGNCVKNTHGKYKTCEDGWTLDLRTLKCAKVGTKGSDDPRSKKSQNVAKQYQLKTFASIVKTDSETKDCGEGKFLNPKTNRCKNLQEIKETSTGKTITTYDPETGEATTEKICNEGYVLNAETNRCNKVKKETSSSSSTSSIVKENETKTCPEGKVLNPKTNRCKTAVTIKETTTGKTVTTFDPETGEETIEKICNDGYVLDSETNRCKKVKINEGEDYELDVPELGGEAKADFIATMSVILIASVGILIVTFQYRKELFNLIKRIIPHKKP